MAGATAGAIEKGKSAGDVEDAEILGGVVFVVQLPPHPGRKRWNGWPAGSREKRTSSWG
jgi:hypothetical protein